MKRSGDQLLLAATIVSAAFGAFLLMTGGGRLSAGGFELAARDWRRPAALALMLLVVRALRMRRQWTGPGALERASSDTAFLVLGTTALAMASLWWYYLDKASGGLDSNGYVSTSALLAAGHMSVPQPVAAWLPFPGAIDAATPLGYVPSPDGSGSVPRFPLGLPLVMALARLLAGVNGPFYVAPLLATATVGLVFATVRRVGGNLAAGLAAVFVAAQPVFLTYALQPMSDVPATFWLVLAAFLFSGSTPMPLLSGLAAGMAMLTRPPLALAAILLPAFARARGTSGAARFLAGFVPCVIAYLLVSTALYGNPFASGYGTADQIFTLEAAPRNLWLYGKWILQVHTVLFPVLVAAAWFVGERQFVWTGLLLFAAVAGPYLLYVPFYDDWETLRFLLPGLVFLIMLAAHAAARIAERRLPRSSAPLLPVVLAIAAAAASYRYVEGRQVFWLWFTESKYPAVADWVARTATPRDIVFASLHSGSIRYYSGRTTVRWDRIPPDRLAATVGAIADRGRRMLLVLDGNYEREEFQQRFGRDTPAGVRIDFVDRVQNVSLAIVERR